MKRFIYVLFALVMMIGIGGSVNSAFADESGIINYNQKNGNEENSADHTPEASNPSDVHISHGDSSGFEFKVPGSNTTYYADKNSPLYKQLHDNHGSSSNDNTGGSNESDSDSGMPKLSSKSTPKHRKTIVTKTTKSTQQNKNLALVHKCIGAIGIAVVLFGAIYGIYYGIKLHRYRKYYR